MHFLSTGPDHSATHCFISIGRHNNSTDSTGKMHIFHAGLLKAHIPVLINTHHIKPSLPGVFQRSHLVSIVRVVDFHPASALAVPFLISDCLVSIPFSYSALLNSQSIDADRNALAFFATLTTCFRPPKHHHSRV